MKGVAFSAVILSAVVAATPALAQMLPFDPYEEQCREWKSEAASDRDMLRDRLAELQRCIEAPGDNEFNPECRDQAERVVDAQKTWEGMSEHARGACDQ